MVKKMVVAARRAIRQRSRKRAVPENERWMHGQYIPVQAINRSQLEYDTVPYGRHEVHTAPEQMDPGLDGLRALPSHYAPVALPRPYYFILDDVVVHRADVVHRENPDRVFLELFPEVTQFVEGANHWVDRAHRHRLARAATTAEFDVETAYYFPSRAAANYYHFLIDSCLRYVDLPELEAIPDGAVFLFEAEPTTWQRKYLELLGISDERIVVAQERPLRVRKLIIGSSRRQRFAVSRDAIDSFTQKVHAGFDIPDAGLPTRFLISRSLAKSRRIRNEDELGAALAPFGVQVVMTEKMSAEEQIALFSRAECVIAPHGAALTNLIYSNAPKVLELIPGDFWGWGYFIQLTHTMGGTHRAVVGQTAHADSDDFSVDIPAITAALSTLDL